MRWTDGGFSSIVLKNNEMFFKTILENPPEFGEIYLEKWRSVWRLNRYRLES